MTPLLKIPLSLLQTALSDLERQHPFAFERVGFLSCRQVITPTGPIVLCCDYHPVPDEDYIEDDTCGARIGERPIHAAMQRILENGSAQIWIHTHGRRRRTNPSHTDLAEGPRLLRSLVNTDKTLCHGWAVVSETSATGQIWVPDEGPVRLQDFTVVGWPMMVSRPSNAIASSAIGDLHARQGFLGPDAPRTFNQAKLAIIGLGGGGSHINQQLGHVGFQNVVYADPQRIEGSNLNRLVGATRSDVDASLLKTEIAERVLRSLQPNASIDSAPARWEDKLDVLSTCDIIFGCLDRFAGRRDLEIFCRSRMIPLIDIGMKVYREHGVPPKLFGQVAVSMPGSHCLRCLNVVTNENLANEAADYGAGPQAQVVWPNGILASAAVGFAVQILTGWTGSSIPPCRLELDGFTQSLTPAAHLLGALLDIPCCHFSVNDSGTPRLRKL